MPKPMSERLPSTIRETLEAKGYSDLAQFAQTNHIKVQTLRNFFQRNKLKPFYTYNSLAECLGLSLYQLRELCRTPHQLNNLIHTRYASVRDLAHKANIGHESVYRLVRGEASLKALDLFLVVSEKLDMPYEMLAAAITAQ